MALQKPLSPARPVLLLHGGAWAMPDNAVEAHRRGIQNALAAGWNILARGGSATDAVVAAITVMEDDDTFDAGRGSFLTRDGRVQCDALLMQGHDLRSGGVACVERLRNPIQAAQLILTESPHVYFVGAGAEVFATQHGMRLISNADLIVPRERERLMRFQQHEATGGGDTTFSGKSEFTSAASGAATTPVILRSEPGSPAGVPGPLGWKATKDRRISSPGSALTSARHPDDQREEGPPYVAPAQFPALPDPALEATTVDRAIEDALPSELQITDPTLHSHDTVGAVALDKDGRLAAGTSTGGTLSKAPGRVGDSSLIGCGCYADNEAAAVSLTGWGEPIMKLVLGKWATDRVAAGSTPQAAASDAIDYLHRRLGGHGGIILLGPDGSVGLAHNTPRMAWGLATHAGQQLGITRNS